MTTEVQPTRENHYTTTAALQARAKELRSQGYIVLAMMPDGVWTGYSCFLEDGSSSYVLELADGELPTGDLQAVYC